MKCFLKSFCLTTLILAIGFFISSFKSAPANDNNGVIVSITKGQFWGYRACGQLVTTKQTFRQNKNQKVHLITLVFELPEGHCMIPEKKAFKINLDGFDAVFTPSGKLIAKYIDNSK